MNVRKAKFYSKLNNGMRRRRPTAYGSVSEKVTRVQSHAAISVTSTATHEAAHIGYRITIEPWETAAKRHNYETPTTNLKTFHTKPYDFSNLTCRLWPVAPRNNKPVV